LPEIETAFRSRLGLPTVYHTTAPGDEAELAKRALAHGTNTIVAVGGDGTCSRIADAIVGANSNCNLAVVPCGTGNDFAKTIGVSALPPDAIAELVLHSAPVRIDVGLADGIHFLNSCGFGFDPAVLAASNKVRLLKGDAVYIYSAVRQLFSYRGIEISADTAARNLHGSMLMVIASNGRFLGGAFQIAPRASVTDGKLDFCFISDTNLGNRVRLFAGALRGTHLGMPGVAAAATDEVSLSFLSKPAIEMDGELRIARGASVTVRCVPHALSVIAAPGFPR
jgi:diacylglycerol kinase (ATP)